MSNNKTKTPEERKEELLAAKERLEMYFNAYTGKKAEKDANGKPVSVADRLAHFANYKEPSKEPEQKKDKAPLSLKDMAEQAVKLEETAKKEGIELGIGALRKAIEEKSKDEKMREQEKNRGKDEKGKDDKDNKKDNDKNKDKKDEMTPAKQEQKMKEMFSKVKLPSGMEIHQEGPSWMLVSKDGKARTDVTDVMNNIDKYNRNVDAANEENRMQNEVQNGADKAVQKDVMKDNGLNISETSGKVQLAEKVVADFKVDDRAAFKPEDVQKVAETALNFSNEKALLEKLKDPKALEEMQKRDKKNEQAAEEKRQMAVDAMLRARAMGKSE